MANVREDQAEGETYLGLFTEEGFHECGWTTKRVGNKTESEARGWPEHVAVFVQRSEMEAAGITPVGK